MDNKDYEYDNDKAFEDYEKTLLAIQRHQICEKIRSTAQEHLFCYIIDKQKLDQIERGEEDENDRND